MKTWLFDFEDKRKDKTDKNFMASVYFVNSDGDLVREKSFAKYLTKDAIVLADYNNRTYKNNSVIIFEENTFNF